jgi:hypothetical protein
MRPVDDFVECREHILWWVGIVSNFAPPSSFLNSHTSLIVWLCKTEGIRIAVGPSGDFVGIDIGHNLR